MNHNTQCPYKCATECPDCAGKRDDKLVTGMCLVAVALGLLGTALAFIVL